MQTKETKGSMADQEFHGEGGILTLSAAVFERSS